jgi:hypothetical protein
MTTEEVLKELDNLQHYIMPLFIEEMAREHSDRIDDGHWFRAYGILITRTQYAHPLGSNYGNSTYKSTVQYEKPILTINL